MSLGQRRHALYTCAICAAEIDTPEPGTAALGKRGAIVIVCVSCSDDMPVARSPERDAYSGGNGPSPVSFRVMAQALKRRQGKAAYDRTSKDHNDRERKPSKATPVNDRDWHPHVQEGKRRIKTGASQKLGVRSSRMGKIS